VLALTHFVPRQPSRCQAPGLPVLCRPWSITFQTMWWSPLLLKGKDNCYIKSSIGTLRLVRRKTYRRQTRFSQQNLFPPGLKSPSIRVRCSMLKDDPSHQAHVAAPSVNVVNAKRLDNDVAINIKNSQSVARSLPPFQTAPTLSKSRPSHSVLPASPTRSSQVGERSFKHSHTILSFHRRSLSSSASSSKAAAYEWHVSMNVISISLMSDGQHAPLTRTAPMLSKSQPTGMIWPVPAILGGNKPKPSPVDKTASAWQFPTPARPMQVVPGFPPVQVESKCKISPLVDKKRKRDLPAP
jgi:hypothetical protein